MEAADAGGWDLDHVRLWGSHQHGSISTFGRQLCSHIPSRWGPCFTHLDLQSFRFPTKFAALMPHPTISTSTCRAPPPHPYRGGVRRSGLAALPYLAALTAAPSAANP